MRGVSDRSIPYKNINEYDHFDFCEGTPTENNLTMVRQVRREKRRPPKPRRKLETKLWQKKFSTIAAREDRGEVIAAECFDKSTVPKLF